MSALLRAVSLRRAARAAAVATIALLSACQTGAPAEAPRSPATSDRDIRAASADLFRAELDRRGESTDQGAVARVRGIGRRLAAAAETPPSGLWVAPGHSWEFAVVQDSGRPDAFAAIGGKIAVSVAMLRIAGDDDGVAAVLGGLVGGSLGDIRAEMPQRAQEFDLALARLRGDPAAAQRAQDSARLRAEEAGRLGLIVMARAGYDPRAAIGVWERVSAAKAGGLDAGEETRIANIRRHLPEALQYYRPR